MHMKPQGQNLQTSPIEQFFLKEQDDSFKNAFYTLLRHKWWLLTPLAAALLLAMVVLQVATPLYTGEATVLIESTDRRIIDIQAVVPERLADAETVQNEAEILRSPALAARVINDLRLDERAEFLPEPESSPGAIQSWLGGITARLFGPVNDAAPEATGLPALPPPAGMEDWPPPEVMQAFASRLDVAPVGRSSVIRVTFTAADPRLAAAVANAVVQTYIDRQVESETTVTAEAHDWLSGRLQQLRTALDESEDAVARFRDEHAMSNGRDAELIRQQIADISRQITEAQTVLNQARVRRDGINAAMDARGPRGAFDVAGSELATSLRTLEAGLRQKQAELSQEYGSRHPVMINLQSEIADLEGQIAAEARNLASAAESEVRIAEQRVQNLQAMLGELQNELSGLSGAEAELEALRRRAEANRQLYDSFLQRSLETAQIDSANPGASIVARAVIPFAPSFPNVPLVLAVAVVGGLGIGLLLVIAAEQFSTGFATPRQLEDTLGLKALAAVPALPRRLRGRVTPQDYVMDKPTSAYAEALRGLDLSIIGVNPRRQSGRIIAVTSALPQEGKTSFVVSLARALALSGQRVLVIDCDVRRPRVHSAFGLANQIGLSNYLRDQAGLAAVMKTDMRSGVDVITTGRWPSDPLALLRGSRFDALLSEAGAAYDVVLIDTAPVLPVPDARTLAQRCEFLVLAKWRQTGRHDTKQAVRTLQESGARFLGAALTQVDLRKIRAYSNGDYSYYRSYAAYHTN